MKRVLVLLAMALLFASTGCLRRQCNCGGAHGPGALRPHGFALHRDDGGLLGRHHRPDDEAGMEGPPGASVGYPYYTLRGPRDFLVDNPPSIGR